ncbi:hypothetical protein C8J56DRAFT_913822 [Mycena floridula]|nr:hypothetical protein C8J56DRAFT_913822 [Mycena floridula]
MGRARMKDSCGLTSIQRLVDQIFLVTKDIQALDKMSLDELDCIELRLQRAAASLRGYRNSRLAVHRVPPEVMTHIFSLTQSSFPSFFPWTAEDFHDLANSRRWLDLLGVCRRWRGIIAMSPQLWSAIDHEADIDTYVKRSQFAPFSVNLLRETPFKEASISTLDILAVHRRRLSQLHFEMSDDPGHLNHRFLTHSVPELISLSIDRATSATTILPAIFGGRMPKLRQLTLSRVSSWPTGYFHDLTHLALSSQSYSDRPSTSIFLDFIEHSLRLEVITLEGAGPSKDEVDDFPPVATGRMISLSSLKELNLSSPFPAFAVARLLSHLSIPANAQLHIISMNPLLEFDDNVASFLPSNISHLQNLDIIEECVISRMKSDVSLVPTSPHHFAISNSKLQLHTSFSSDQFTPFCDRYPLINVVKLSIFDASIIHDGIGQIGVDQWKELLVRLPSLTTLNISNMYGTTPLTNNILTALESDDNKYFLCPLLQSLHIDEEYTMPTLRLFGFLTERSEQGKKLRQLTVSYRNHALPGSISPANPYLSAFTKADAEKVGKHVGEMIFLPHETVIDRIYYPGFGSAYVRMFKRLNIGWTPTT